MSNKTVVPSNVVDHVLVSLNALSASVKQILDDCDAGRAGVRAHAACQAVIDEIADLKKLLTGPVDLALIPTDASQATDPDQLFGPGTLQRLQTDLTALVEEAKEKLRELAKVRAQAIGKAFEQHREALGESTTVGVMDYQLGWQGATATDLLSVASAFAELAGTAPTLLGTLMARNILEVERTRPVTPVVCLSPGEGGATPVAENADKAATGELAGDEGWGQGSLGGAPMGG